MTKSQYFGWSLTVMTTLLCSIAVSLRTKLSAHAFSITSTATSRTFPRTYPTRLFVAASSSSSSSSTTAESQKVINLHTIPKDELEEVLKSWGYPKFRANQVYTFVRETGVISIDDMHNLPLKLRNDLKEYASLGTLQLDLEMISKDGTKKRAYRLQDGQLIESVLMPYEDGRCTACISSQAGCAMGCVFCATGQMGFARQLTPDEIFEQVSRFASELKKEKKRLSNIVFMGMGEPLANYRNVKAAINRITQELGIGARRITVSTVGVVPNIKKLTTDPELPQIRLAVSLHCASEEERTALMPANARYGGLDELMTTLRDYIDTTGRRITLEWALIEGQNDTPDTARKLGRLIKRHNLRPDMVHINVIPLNPTGGFAGTPSGRSRVNEFVRIMEQDFGVSTTPRVRRGIDIDAGCGQLKATIEKKKKEEEDKKKRLLEEKNEITMENDQRELKSFMEESSSTATTLPSATTPMVGVYEDEEEEQQEEDSSYSDQGTNQVVKFSIDQDFVVIDDDYGDDDFEDPEFETEWELQEADRLINLVQQSFPAAPAQQQKQDVVDVNKSYNNDNDDDNSILKGPTTKITDEEAVIKARKRRKKLLRNLKQIGKLKDSETAGKELNEEQTLKVAREEEWLMELESLEHNLQ